MVGVGVGGEGGLPLGVTVTHPAQEPPRVRPAGAVLVPIRCLQERFPGEHIHTAQNDATTPTNQRTGQIVKDRHDAGVGNVECRMLLRLLKTLCRQDILAEPRLLFYFMWLVLGFDSVLTARVRVTKRRGFQTPPFGRPPS